MSNKSDTPLQEERITVCTNCSHLEDHHKWYAQDEENWGGEEHWECREDECTCEVDWSSHHFIDITVIVKQYAAKERWPKQSSHANNSQKPPMTATSS